MTHILGQSEADKGTWYPEASREALEVEMAESIGRGKVVGSNEVGEDKDEC